ncbi:MAG TPA: nuclear transport factor 2 family protein, partial [Myxococcota bacterium]|nr:nuclear transport factor 2 family protein [Myxococcota bacterium]
MSTRARAALGLLVASAASAVAYYAFREPAPDVVPRAALPVAGKLVLNGVTVVDVRMGRLAPGMSVVADAGKIASVAPVGTPPPDPSAETVDATGLYVVPGYLDLHVHALGHGDPSDDLALMLANGVTGFRQMDGSDELLAQRRAGALPLGRDAPAVLAMPGELLTPFNAGDPAAAIAEVRAQQAAGADFVKVALLAPDVFLAVLAEAQRIGIPVSGHVPADVDVLAAARAGMRSIEHLGPSPGLLVDCSTDTEALVAAAPRMPGLLTAMPVRLPFLEALADRFLQRLLVNPTVRVTATEVHRLERVLATQDDARCRSAARELAATGTAVVPTLIRLRTQRFAGAPEYAHDPNLRYVPAETLATWRSVTREFDEAFSPEQKETLRRLYARDLELVKLLDSEGVRLLAGSDAVGAGWTIAGFGLHQELDQLAAAGLAPLRVLQLATLDGAAFLGRAAELGAVEVGKDADLVLLEANPLESVENLHRIAGVVRAGFHHSKSDLEALKHRVAGGGVPMADAKAEISELVAAWAHFRDQERWDELLDAFHADGTISLSWYDGPYAGFVAASRRLASGGGAILKHRLGTPVVETRGDRALSEVDVTIMVRSKTPFGEVDTTSWARFYDQLERRDGRWRIAKRTAVYEKDRADPVDRAGLPDEFFAGLEAYPAPLKFLGSSLQRMGVRLSETAVLDGSPELAALR